MVGACKEGLPSEDRPLAEMLSAHYLWFQDSTQRGLAEAGREYLRHLLSEEQLALFRVVTRDAYRFPELGQQYQKNVAQGRTRFLSVYLKSVSRANAWEKRDSMQDAALYEALLRAGIYEEVLHGLIAVDSEIIDKQARSASKKLWKLLTSGS